MAMFSRETTYQFPVIYIDRESRTPFPCKAPQEAIGPLGPLDSLGPIASRGRSVWPSVNMLMT